MKVTKKNIPTTTILSDRNQEARFWEKNFDDAWEKGKPINIMHKKTNAKDAKSKRSRISPRLAKNL